MSTLKEDKRQLLITRDGSVTIYDPARDVTYRSRHGALTESMHVFINAGFLYAMQQHGNNLNILEAGFGTGLNALLTLMHARKSNCIVRYTGIDLHPLPEELIQQTALHLNNEDQTELYKEIHLVFPEGEADISNEFRLIRTRADIATYRKDNTYHLIYYDPFAPSAQPELWIENVFHNMYDSLVPGGIMVTYCSKTIVRKAMEAAGFHVEKLQGPHGKREIVRAVKR
jgi:tRNA U34 5-methylaminomethyl-2-thiouridine-forming methyltransferase MnmC